MQSESNYSLKDVIEISTTIAVFLGLIFVGLELRQNTEAVQATTFQSITDSSSDFLLSVVEDDDLMRLWSTGGKNYENLSPEDRGKYSLLRRIFWIRMQNAYSQWKRGTLEDRDWQLYKNVMCSESQSAKLGTEQTFTVHERVLSDDFVAFIKNCWSNDSKR